MTVPMKQPLLVQAFDVENGDEALLARLIAALSAADIQRFKLRQRLETPVHAPRAGWDRLRWRMYTPEERVTLLCIALVFIALLGWCIAEAIAVADAYAHPVFTTQVVYRNKVNLPDIIACNLCSVAPLDIVVVARGTDGINYIAEYPLNPAINDAAVARYLAVEDFSLPFPGSTTTSACKKVRTSSYAFYADQIQSPLRIVFNTHTEQCGSTAIDFGIRIGLYPANAPVDLSTFWLVSTEIAYQLGLIFALTQQRIIYLDGRAETSFQSLTGITRPIMNTSLVDLSGVQLKVASFATQEYVETIAVSWLVVFTAAGSILSFFLLIFMRGLRGFLFTRLYRNAT